jgi:hypothetical protein
VAYYVSYAKGQKGQRTAKIEYFDDKGLENFFLNRPKENNGIVQKFEDPTSPYNTVLRAYWTPHKLQLQQRVNKYEIGDLRVVMNDRLSTFDGPEYLNVEFEIKSYKLKLRLTETVNSIVEHIQMLLPSAYTLWTMECFFKLSGKNKLLFLWCNDLRVFNTNGIFPFSILCTHSSFPAPCASLFHISAFLLNPSDVFLPSICNLFVENLRIASDHVCTAARQSLQKSRHFSHHL